jgi:hypothetical protein
MNSRNGMSCSLLFTNCTIFSPDTYAYDTVGITIQFLVHISGSHILFLLQSSQMLLLLTPPRKNQNMWTFIKNYILFIEIFPHTYSFISTWPPRNLPEGKGAWKADNLTAICEPIV